MNLTKPDFSEALIREFPRRNETAAEACIDTRSAADRRNGAERRSGARWVARAIAAARRRALRRSRAAPYGKQEQRYGYH